jgi:hypothetical protein
MKKVTTAVLAVAALAMAVPAFSAVLLDEQFPYADGDIVIVSGGSWANHSGTVNPTVVSQELKVDGINESGDVNRAFAAQANTATTYACMMVRVDGSPVSSGATNYFAHFRSSVNTFNFRSRVFVMNEPGGATFTFGLNTTSTSVSSPNISWGTALTFGQVYTVVHSYNATTGESKLWVNPVTEASASISSSVVAAAGEAIDQYAFRQATTVVQQFVDDLKVGQTFSEACDGATPTTATSWGRVKALYR